jgi:hypothetical protein
VGLEDHTHVIYHPCVPICARIRCKLPAVATVHLSYDARVVVIGDLASERSPYLLDLCDEHVRRLTPPIGWRLRDQRAQVMAGLR